MDVIPSMTIKVCAFQIRQNFVADHLKMRNQKDIIYVSLGTLKDRIFL